MAASTKINNNLFVWGNSTVSSSDFADINYNQTTHTADGEKSGNLLYATVYNSLGRNSSLIPYSIIEVLRFGPYGQQSGETLDNSTEAYTNAWDTGLTTFDVDYDVHSQEIATLITNLRTAFNTYLKYSQTYRSIQANVWTNPRKITLADSSDIYHGVSTIIDGGITNYDVNNGYVLHLPSTITANLSGTASNVTTTTNTANDLLLVGVTSSTTTSLKRDTRAKVNGSTLTLGDSSNSGAIHLNTGNNYIQICENQSLGGSTAGAYISHTSADYSIQIGSMGFTVDGENTFGSSYGDSPGNMNFFQIVNDNTVIWGQPFVTITQNKYSATDNIGFLSDRIWKFTNTVFVGQINFTANDALGNTYFIDGTGDAHLRNIQVNKIGDTSNRTSELWVQEARFGPNGTTNGSVNSAGECTMKSYLATSDSRLKENIQPYECEKSILDLPVVEFDYKDHGGHHIGCLAQDLQKICPELVHETAEGYLTIEENKLVYLLLQEVKELQKEVIVLQKEVKKLKGK